MEKQSAFSNIRDTRASSMPEQDPKSSNTGWESLMGTKEDIENNYRDNKEWIESKAKKDFEYRTTKREPNLEMVENRYQEDLENHDRYMTWLKENKDRTEDEYNREFIDQESSNKPLRDTIKHTKEIYPRMDQESNAEYNERLNDNNARTIISDYFPKENGESVKEYSKRIGTIYETMPRNQGERGADYAKRINENYEEFLQGVAEKTIDKNSKNWQQLQDDFSNIEDMRKGNVFDKERAKVLRKKVLEEALQKQSREREQERADDWANQRKAKLEQLRERKAAELQHAKATPEEDRKLAEDAEYFKDGFKKEMVEDENGKFSEEKNKVFMDRIRGFVNLIGNKLTSIRGERRKLAARKQEILKQLAEIRGANPTPNQDHSSSVTPNDNSAPNNTSAPNVPPAPTPNKPKQPADNKANQSNDGAKSNDVDDEDSENDVETDQVFSNPDEYEEYIYKNFKNLGKETINILTSTRPLDKEYADRISDWWHRPGLLDEASKRQILDIMEKSAGLNEGSALRELLHWA